MTVEDIKQFMLDHPGEALPVGSGWIDPQAAIDLLQDDYGLIDILKGERKELNDTRIPST